jgi:2,3-bisphosphoglycerate-independent phosphoglycerate mutase
MKEASSERGLVRENQESRFDTEKKSVALIILDGWGLAPKGKYNAVSQAKTPNLDSIIQRFGSISICASGTCVGLNKGQMGNSEVGHLTIGAGRVIFQDLMRVNHKIDTGALEKNKDLLEVLGGVKSNESTLHLLGLVSNGGVHSHIEHLYGILRTVRKKKIKKVAVHAFLDGRDTPPRSGINFVSALDRFMKTEKIGRIRTLSGRYYAMDRDNRWDRTKLAYDAIVHAMGVRYENSDNAIESSYSKGITDEFLVPCVIDEYDGVRDSDAMFFFNFRPDRARQLTKALVQSEKEFQGKFHRGRRPRNIDVLTMTVYDPELKNVKAILGQEHVSDTLSNVLERNNIPQLRIAETEKYAHVTYFFNGLNEAPRKLEQRFLVPSAKEVGTYDKKPEMSAIEITQRASESLESKRYGFVLINYANADMVGHSGNIKATIKAVETVDRCLGKIHDLWKKLNNESYEFDVFVSADHGNAEKMFDPKTGQPHTAHTSNLVPLTLLSERWRFSLPRRGYKAGLVDIAPSVLDIMGIEKPLSMSGVSIVSQVKKK